jgi:hypothetical protein
MSELAQLVPEFDPNRPDAGNLSDSEHRRPESDAGAECLLMAMTPPVATERLVAGHPVFNLAFVRVSDLAGSVDRQPNRNTKPQRMVAT